MSPKYHLTYFDLTGLGEPIRMLLHYGGIEFTETRVLRQEWLALKPCKLLMYFLLKMKILKVLAIEPLQQLPVLDVDGKRMHQSTSIARYLGKQVGLAGDNDWESYEIDAVADTVMDFRHGCGTSRIFVLKC